jgi:hypothetical protein
MHLLAAAAVTAVTAAIVPDEFLGPEGLLIAALVTVGVLARLHFQSDVRDRAERDEWKRLYLGARVEFHKLAEADEGALGIEPPA